jgi:diamine N-acetyltransferase
MPLIRPASLADAARLAAFAEAAFRQSHAGDSAQTDLDTYVAGHFGPDLQAAEIADPTTTFFLGLEGAEIVGYLQLRRAPDGSAEAKRVYVASIGREPAWPPT